MEERVGEAGGVYQQPVLGLLKDYKLTFNKAAYPEGSGYADVIPTKGSLVYGYAYLMDEKAFELMDGYEGCFKTTEFDEGTTECKNGSHYFRMKIKLQV